MGSAERSESWGQEAGAWEQPRTGVAAICNKITRPHKLAQHTPRFEATMSGRLLLGMLQLIYINLVDLAI